MAGCGGLCRKESLGRANLVRVELRRNLLGRGDTQLRLVHESNKCIDCNQGGGVVRSKERKKKTSIRVQERVLCMHACSASSSFQGPKPVGIIHPLHTGPSRE